MSISSVISLVAIIFSISAFILSYVQNRKLSNENMRLQRAIFYMARNQEFETKLAEWPDALKFFGIDVKKVKREDGISEQQITYLILSIHALSAYCRAEEEDIFEHIKNNDYRRRLFSHRETRTAWKHARVLFSDYIRNGIDRYLKEEYPNEYQDNS